jgi:zinc transport system permease protein
MPEPAASAAPRAKRSIDDEFDALLEEPDREVPPLAVAPSAAPAAVAIASRAEIAVEPPDQRQSPTWADFRAGWQLGIYQDPILCAVLAGAALGLVGVFVVLRRAVFVTAAVSQSAALGVAFAFLLEIHADVRVPPVASALALALCAAGLLALRTNGMRLPREALLGFAYVAASALAVLAGDRIAQEAHDVAAILFGTAVVVRPLDLRLVAGTGALVVLAVVASYRGLVFAGFDPEGARVQRVPVRRLDWLLWVLVALEVSVATRAIGALPVFAFAVLPAMAALALVERLSRALLVAALLGALAGAAGYLGAFFLELPVGATQAALAALPFLAALAARRLR